MMFSKYIHYTLLKYINTTCISKCNKNAAHLVVHGQRFRLLQVYLLLSCQLIVTFGIVLVFSLV